MRLLQHNAGETSSTRYLIPWKLGYVEQMASKTEALIREKNLKKATRDGIHALLTHSRNIVFQCIREVDGLFGWIQADPHSVPI